jgi:hypothetical protein
MKRLVAALACALLPLGATAQQILVEFTGKVTRVHGVREGVLADAQVGETVEGLAMFDASQLLAVNGDNSTFLRLRAPWTNGIDLLRSSLTIGDRSVSMEGYAFTLGSAGIDDDRVPASPPGAPAADRFFVSDWSSPYDLSNPAITVAPSRILNVSASALAPSAFVTGPVTSLYVPLNWPAAETLTGTITDGVGRRIGPTTWAFDVNDPPLNHEQHAMLVEFSLESMTKVTCRNRLPWVDFGWPWPRYPVTCAVSQRKR